MLTTPGSGAEGGDPSGQPIGSPVAPSDPAVTPASSLTPHQLRVIRLFANSWTWHRVAAELGVSKNTVDKHRREAFERLEEHAGFVVACKEDAYRALGWLVVP